MKSLLAAFQFLTILPVPARLDDGHFTRAPFWFPVVGLTLGVLVAFADALFERMGFSPLLQSTMSIGLLAALSGGLHLDGLADTADGFLSARSRERALEIMRDSRIGTMGALALFFVLALKVAALFELGGALRWRALMLAPLAGRAMQLAVMNTLPYARNEGGLASVFLRRKHPALVLWAALWLVIAAILSHGPTNGLLTTVGIGIAVLLLSLWSQRRIGGFTGDTLGATSEITEAVVLLLAVLDR
jgi:adenosylcobinamide-GDP ribazoletransferase